jgi:hypothetical protein
VDLTDRFARGDLEAFEQLFAQFHGDVYRWLVRLVRDPAAAEDLTVAGTEVAAGREGGSGTTAGLASPLHPDCVIT